MLSCQKHLFSLPTGTHYLNGAYMSPLPRSGEAAGIEAVRQKGYPGQIGPRDFFGASDEVRALFARLVNIENPQSVALIPAASYGLATVARNTRIGPGEKIVVVQEQFPSNVYTWRRLAETSGGHVHVVAPPDTMERRGAIWNERILDAIDSKTVLVAIPHIHWADGTLFDLASIGARAREVGAAFVIDGTQSVGALPFDVQAFRPDALVCAGYKWLLGPYSIGLAYYGPRYADGIPLEENWISRLHSEDFSGLVKYEDAYQPGALRFDVGERSQFMLAPMLAAGVKHLLAWGPASIQEYCTRLTEPYLAEIEALGFQIEMASLRAAHLFGIRVPPGSSLERIQQALTDNHISVSLRGNAIRISPNVYNDVADMEALVTALTAGCAASSASVAAQ